MRDLTARVSPSWLSAAAAALQTCPHFWYAVLDGVTRRPRIPAKQSAWSAWACRAVDQWLDGTGMTYPVEGDRSLVAYGRVTQSYERRSTMTRLRNLMWGRRRSAQVSRGALDRVSRVPRSVKIFTRVPFTGHARELVHGPGTVGASSLVRQERERARSGQGKRAIRASSIPSRCTYRNSLLVWGTPHPYSFGQRRIPCV